MQRITARDPGDVTDNGRDAVTSWRLSGRIDIAALATARPMVEDLR